MSEQKCGKRSKNFSEAEKNLLFELVSTKFINIIENKKTDGVTVSQKKEAWEEISKIYNTQATSGVRSAKQLHALYDLLKKNARSNLFEDKKNLYKTGGGSFTSKTSIIDEKIVTVLKPQFEPLPNKYDSSADYLSNVAPTSKQLIIKDDNNEETIIEQEEHKELKNEQFNSKLKLKKKASSPTLPEKKKKCINILTNRFVTRKENKDNNDKTLFLHKEKNLNLENEIKQRQLQLIEQQLANAKLEYEIKKKELEIKELTVNKLKNVV